MRTKINFRCCIGIITLNRLTMEAMYFNEFEPITVSVTQVIDYNSLYIGG